MAAPKALTGAPTTITVDGIDLHTYGVTVTSVDNPLPSAVESVVNVLGLDGAIDFTRNFGMRVMTISGDITADTHSALLGYIDALNTLFRLRERYESIKVVFSDQTDRTWSCRYESFTPKLKTLKNYGRTAAFTLSFKLAKPYSEGTPVRLFTRLSNNTALKINYSGSIKTPINLSISPTEEQNLLDVATGLISSENCLAWTYSNAVGSNNSSRKLYGSNSVAVTRSSAGLFYAEIDLTSQITTTKNYVFGAWINSVATSTNTIQIILTGGTTVTKDVYATSTGLFVFGKILVTAAELAGVTSVKMRIYNDGSQSTFNIDGAFCYELQSCDTDGDLTDFVPPPYKVNSAVLSNPEIQLHNGRNIYPFSNGENGGTYTHTTINDPIGEGRCFLFQSSSATEKGFYSEPVYVIPGKTYRVSVETILRHYKSLSGSTPLYYYVRFHDEFGNQIYFDGTATEMSSEEFVWIPHYNRVTAPESAVTMSIAFVATNVECSLFIKNIMIYEEVNGSEPFLTTYVAPNKLTQLFAGSLYAGDELTINNSRLAVDISYLDDETVANGMSAFGGDRLELVPGTNYMRLRDARSGSNTPESASTGTCAAWLSYIPRYL